jgi:XisI protein
METLKKYQQILYTFLKEYAQHPYENVPEIEFQLIADYENNHFQLVAVGWEKNKFIHETIFHFDIKNGKIWIQKNETDILIADLFVSQGIRRDDIILGFVPSYARPYSGFAVA